jgi:hypothetical protein
MVMRLLSRKVITTFAPVRQRQVGHAGQRVWMLRPKHPLANL